VGSLLGILVVLGTAGALIFVIITFLQNQANAPVVTLPPVAAATSTLEPSGSAGPASPSASASAEASIEPALTPLPTTEPAATPTSGTTPAPTPFVPTVNVGPGYITFGTNSNSQLEVTDPTTIFGADERMVWSAYLIDRANSADLRIVVLKLDPAAPDGQRLVAESDVRPVANGAQLFLRRTRVSTIIDGPGLYTVRYVRGDQIMSEGSFLVGEQPDQG
jgi:hypothetical protein